MMEGIQYSYRPSNNAYTRNRYPLSFDQRLTQGDRYREAAEQLEANLKSIEQFHSSSIAQAHTGGPNCESCAEKNRRIKQAFFEYYLGKQRDRWDEDMTIYHQELEEMFSRSEITLEAIHLRFKTELKEHLRRDMCTVQPQDGKDIVDHKMRLDQLLREFSIEEALAKGFQEKVDRLAAVPGLDGQLRSGNIGDATDPAGFLVRLQGAKSTEERANLYIAYYCNPNPDDAPQLRNMKTKYAKYFESGMSHDNVLELWKADAKNMKSREVEGLQQRLAELKMAQSAHLKIKKRKMMKEDAKLKDKQHLVECSLPGCERQMDYSKERVIECAICDWLARRNDQRGVDQRRHFYYCSQDHNDEDFDEHDRLEHGCVIGNLCPYAMDPPPLEACGICSNCSRNGTTLFFCSEECYSQTHRHEIHYDGGDGGAFINFQPVAGLELTS